MADTASVEQANGTVTESQEGRTFTQAELDEILQARLGKERAKYSDYEVLKEKASKYDEVEEASKSELQKATERANALQAKIDAMEREAQITSIRAKIASETGVPITLLSGDTEEACKVQADGILAFAKPGAYPTVKDGGEAQIPTSRTAQDQFADWFNASFQ